MKLDIGTDLNQWVRKLIHSGKFKDTNQVKAVNEARKSLGDKEVALSKDTIDATCQNNNKAKKVSFDCAKGVLSQDHEVLNDVTPSSLRLTIYSTLRAQSAEPTQDLVIRGEHNSFLNKPLSAQKLRCLAKACPSLRKLAIEDLNLSTAARRKRINLADFPTTLCLLSIRDTVIEVETFLKSKRDFYNIRVLDLGRSLDARRTDISWPLMTNIEELYLEGAQGFGNVDFLQTVLVNCPTLKVLDLEGTDVGLEALELISELAPQVEALYLGVTDIRDENFLHMERLRMNLRCLVMLCLADTQVGDYGLNCIRRMAPNLRDVTVNGQTVKQTDNPEDVYLPLRINRKFNHHIGTVFRNHGCGHFRETHRLQS